MQFVLLMTKTSKTFLYPPLNLAARFENERHGQCQGSVFCTPSGSLLKLFSVAQRSGVGENRQETGRGYSVGIGQAYSTFSPAVLSTYRILFSILHLCSFETTTAILDASCRLLQYTLPHRARLRIFTTK